jgi:hypothetical protein
VGGGGVVYGCVVDGGEVLFQLLVCWKHLGHERLLRRFLWRESKLRFPEVLCEASGDLHVVEEGGEFILHVLRHDFGCASCLDGADGRMAALWWRWRWLVREMMIMYVYIHICIYSYICFRE